MPFDPLFSSDAKPPARPLYADHKIAFDTAIKKELRKLPFKPPKRRFDQTSERQRQQTAIDRANGF